MKKLYLIRHSKSSWDDLSLKDFDRPLNKRGKRDAPLMAKRIKEKEIQFDIIYSSPAKRAKKTAEIFSKELDFQDDIVFKKSLYEASQKDFLNIITETDDNINAIAIFSHNPTINNFVSKYFDDFHQNIPTCAIFAMEIHDSSWKNFVRAEKFRLFFHYPKES